jgi:hypothetical protein
MENSIHYCENCGSPLEAGASFCEACGAPVVKAPAQPQPPPPAPPAPVYYQTPPPPPPVYYSPPAPPPPGYYPAPAPPRRKPSTGLIVGGVVLGLVVCCGLAALVFTLAGGAAFLAQYSEAGQNLPTGMVVQDTAAPAEPFPPATDIPVAAEPTLTSQPAPNTVQATPALPVPQGDILDYTDDLSTNDNQWTVDDQTTGPRAGFYPSAYFIDTDKQQGEYIAMLPKINDNPNEVRDFEIEFYGLQWSGDGYLGLDFHWLNRQNYYQVALKDGKFLIRKKVNGQFLNLTPGWVASSSILGGPNKITVVMHGDVIQLKINDDVMAQLKDDSLAFGAVALTAGVLPEAPDGTEFEGRFNNFHVLWYVPQ